MGLVTSGVYEFKQTANQIDLLVASGLIRQRYNASARYANAHWFL
jgi:hypothetical protein